MQRFYDLRNTRIAHQENPLDDSELAEKELKYWMETLSALATA